MKLLHKWRLWKKYHKNSTRWVYRVLWKEPPYSEQVIAMFWSYTEAKEVACGIAAIIRPDIPAEVSGVQIRYDSVSHLLESAQEILPLWLE